MVRGSNPLLGDFSGSVGQGVVSWTMAMRGNAEEGAERKALVWHGRGFGPSFFEGKNMEWNQAFTIIGIILTPMLGGFAWVLIKLWNMDVKLSIVEHILSVKKKK